jgi:hypothetical protein
MVSTGSDSSDESEVPSGGSRGSCCSEQRSDGPAGGNGDHAIPNDNGHNGGDAAPNPGPAKSRGDPKTRSNRPPPARRSDSKPKETLVNGTATA